MNRHGQRLDHSSFIIGHAFRNRGHLGSLYRKVFTGGTGGLEAHDFQLFAKVVFAMPAGVALSAINLRLNGYLLADRQIMNIGANGHDASGYFVALRHRVFCERMFSMINMDIASAYPDFHDFHHNLIGRGFRLGDLSENDFSGCRHNLLKHVDILR